MNKLKQTLEKILKQEESFLDTETKEINYNKVKDSADKIDKKLIAILAENRETKDKFFTKIKDVYVFDNSLEPIVLCSLCEGGAVFFCLIFCQILQ